MVLPPKTPVLPLGIFVIKALTSLQIPKRYDLETGTVRRLNDSNSLNYHTNVAPLTRFDVTRP